MTSSCSFVFRLYDIGRLLAHPFFAVIGFALLCSKSMSFTLSRVSSTGLMPVSMLIWSLMDRLFLALAIIIRSLSLDGKLMFLASGLYLGMFHVIA